MSVRTVLVLLLIGAGIVAVFALNPQLRSKVGGTVEAVKEEFGPGEDSPTMGGQPKVYVPRGDRLYHTRDCPRIQGQTPVPMPLGKAKEICAPCPECNPPR